MSNNVSSKSHEKHKENNDNTNSNSNKVNKISDKEEFDKLQNKILDNYRKKIKQKLPDNKINYTSNNTSSLTERNKNIPQNEKNFIKENFLKNDNNDNNDIANLTITMISKKKKISNSEIKKINVNIFF